jgi:hypothetical protein
MKMYLPPAGGKPTRRGFLRKGLFGGAILSLAALGWLGTRKGVEVALPAKPLEAVSPAQYAVLVVLAQRFIPKRANFPTSDALGVAKAADAIIALLDPSARTEVLQLLSLFENGAATLLLSWRFARPFTRLGVDEQDVLLEDWRTSRLTLRRTGYMALRGLLMASFYGNPATWGAVGYPGPLPGIHQPDAPVWRGAGAVRPESNGRYTDPQPTDTDAGQETP